MVNDRSAPPCPRCGTPFPLTAHACRNCGLTQEVAQDPEWRATAAIPSPNYPPQDANAAYNPYIQQPYNTQQPYNAGGQPPYGGPPQPPPSWEPPPDPFAPSRHGKPVQAVSSDYSVQPKHSFWRSFAGVSLIAFLLLMVVGVSAFGIYYYPMLCSAQQRNDLPANIPLPCGITFQDHLDRSASGTTGPGSTEWVYTVDSQSPTQLYTFYQNNLPGDGWTLPSSIQSPENNAVAACQGQTVALINGQQGTVSEGSATFTSPSGGSVLLIILAPLKNLAPQIQQGCALT